MTIRSENRYFSWQVRAIKDEAVAQAIKQNNILKKSSIFCYVDNFKFSDKLDDRQWYIPHQPTLMLAAVGGLLSWVAIPSNTISNCKYYSVNDIDNFIKTYKLENYPMSIDYNLEQSILSLEPSSVYVDNYLLVLNYYYIKFLEPDRYNNFLESLVLLKIQNIKYNQ